MEVQTQAKQSVSLSFKNGSSDKVYNVELTVRDDDNAMSSDIVDVNVKNKRPSVEIICNK